MYCPGMQSLDALRKSTGRSRARVAADLDMSERHLQRIESGRQPLRRVLALAFANYYGVEVDEIAGQEEAA